MKDQESVIVLSEISDPSCSSDELDSHIGKDKKIDRIIASHVNAGAATLKKLAMSNDAKTRECVAGNPNTPRDMLINYLAEDFPKALLMNPAFDLMVLESPDFLADIYESALAAILRQAECPTSIVEWAFAHYSSRDDFSAGILKAITQNPAVKVSMIEEIILMDTPIEITGAEGAL